MATYRFFKDGIDYTIYAVAVILLINSNDNEGCQFGCWSVARRGQFTLC
jgi:hypothetical protein